MKILLGVLGGVLVVVLGGLAWMGALSRLEVQERDMGPYQFVYVQEPSSDAGRIGRLTDALGERLEAAGITQRKPAQQYYATGRGLQNQVGFLVEQAVSRDVLGTETFFRPIPAQRYVVMEFPFRNRLSFMLGSFRVDPVMRKYLAQKKYARTSAMVILEGDTLLYLEPIAPA